MKRYLVGIFCTAAVAVAVAQDSVSKTPCLPGDAVAPWTISEQCNGYVVDLSPLTTSWGRSFGIAPVVKTSKSNSTNFTSLSSSSSLSRRHKLDVGFASATYGLWTTAGQGVNDDSAINDPPGTVIDGTVLGGSQFALVTSEFSTTDALTNYNGVIGAIINYQDSNLSRLYVKRVMAANNGCNNASNLSQFGIGSVDATGNTYFRADGAGTSASCGLTNISTAAPNNNLFGVAMQSRNCSALNVVSNDYVAGGQFDKPATRWMVRNSANTHGTPNNLPAELNLGTAIVLGTDGGKNFVRGTDFGAMTADQTQLCGFDHRGNMAYTGRNFGAPLNSTAGIGMVLGKSTATGNPTSLLNVFGINSTGGVTGTLCLGPVPQNVADCGGNQPFNPGENPWLFEHYRSQTIFRGGNGPGAVGVDRAGNLLAAGIVYDELAVPGANDRANFIVMSRTTPAGVTSWTVVAMNLDTTGLFATPIKNGAGGATIGVLTTLDNVTGGAPQGPSMSAPMIDSVGNVWFMSAVALDTPAGVQYNNALLCAIYDETNFCYELELICKLGDAFVGQNSARNWKIDFMSIADSNSVDSATEWSNNVSEVNCFGGDPDSTPTTNEQHLGGLILTARIVYDYDQDGSFIENCSTAGSNDQDYNVVLFIGQSPVTACEPCDTNCDGTVNPFDINSFLAVLSGTPGCSPCAGDANNDGTTNPFDINAFLACLGG